MRKAAIIGAGGHAAVVIEAARASADLDIVVSLDPSPPAAEVLGVPVIGGDERLGELRAQGIDAIVLGIGGNRLRAVIGTRALGMGFALPAIVHPSAVVSISSTVGEGAVIMARAVVGTRSVVGRFAIINTAAAIDHDCIIGESAHVAPGVTLAGCVGVGARSLIGVGSAARPHVCIGEDVTIGAGSAIVSDIEAGSVAFGVPARSSRA